MIRKHATLTLLAASLLQASLVQALGLGDITLRSSLDEPLAAEIRLRGVSDLNHSQIIVRLGSQADFERAGVDRLFFLSDMKFEVQLQGDSGVVYVSSDQPIREPYLDFVVEVRWPNGRVLREYTVLLDLPTYQSAAPEAARAPVTRSAPRSATSSGGQWSGDSYTVARNDTLWSIASRARPDGVSIQRMMIAIHRDNPEAFIRGNINLLRSGAVLRMPAASEIDALSQQEALSEVSSHDHDWRGGADTTYAPEPVAASEPSMTEATPVEAEPVTDDAYLRLSGDSVEGEPGSNASAGSGAGAGGTEILAENLSAAERENAELQERLAALEEQVKDYERLVELKSDEAAAVQQQSGAETAPAVPEETPPAAPADSGETQSLLDRLLGNTMVLAAALGLAVLAMLAFLFARRRGAAGLVPVPEHELRQAARKAPSAAAAPIDDEDDEALARSEETKARFGAPERARARAADQGEIADPLSEADIFLAYGKPQTAIEVLQKALAVDASLATVRLKLMEIYAEQGDGEGFLGEYDRFTALGDEESLEAARELIEDTDRAHWLRSAEPREAPMDWAQEPAPTPAPAVSVVAELETLARDLDTDSRALPAVEVPEQPEAAMDAGEFELDELELGLDDEDQLAEEPESAALEESPDELAPLGEMELPGATTAEDAAADSLVQSDEVETKLELARAYIDMGDYDGARDILDEVLAEGGPAQREQASAMLETIRSA